MERCLSEVWWKVIQLVPKRYGNMCRSLYDSIMFSAPETIPFWWRQCETLIESITVNEGVTHKWQVRVLNVWSMQSTERICETLGLDYLDLKNDGVE